MLHMPYHHMVHMPSPFRVHLPKTIKLANNNFYLSHGSYSNLFKDGWIDYVGAENLPEKVDITTRRPSKVYCAFPEGVGLKGIGNSDKLFIDFPSKILVIWPKFNLIWTLLTNCLYVKPWLRSSHISRIIFSFITWRYIFLFFFNTIYFGCCLKPLFLSTILI